MKSLISWSEIQIGDFRAAMRLLAVQTQSILCVIAVSVAILAPALIFGVPSNLDLTNHFRFALPFHDAVSAGNLYPGWLAESNSGYGDPSFRFYPPGLYYLLSLFRVLTGDWYAGTLASFTLLSVAGSLGIYFWARTILSEAVAMWAAIFYALMPYHVNQFYQAVLLAEYAGAAVLPLALAFADRVCTRRRAIDVAWLGFAYAVLVLTHLPLTIIGSLALFVYVVARAETSNRLKTLGRFFAAILLGLAASGFYWVRMVMELGWISINVPNSSSAIDYRNEFLFSAFSPDNLNVWWMNILAILTLLMIAPAVALARQVASIRGLKAVNVLFAASLLMSIPVSYPLWKVVPPLQQTQFPWRWLVMVSICASIIGASAMPFWIKLKDNNRRPTRLVVLGLVLISVSFTLSHTVREAVFLSQPQFRTLLNTVRGSESVDLWFPVWATGRPTKMDRQVQAGDRPISIEHWQPEQRAFQLAPGETREARIRTFYYPHWEASANGKPLSTRPADDGALIIEIPAEAAVVTLVFREPVSSKLSRVLSLLGAMAIVAVGSFGWLKTVRVGVL